MGLTTETIKDATIKAEEFFRNQPEGVGAFSNAIRLVQQCNALGAQADVNRNDLFLVQIAALFLFTGISSETGIEQSVQNANSFLDAAGASSEEKIAVRDYMLSILPPQMPMSTAAQVLCDALNSFWVDNTKSLHVDLPQSIVNVSTGSGQEVTIAGTLQHVQKIKFFTPEARKLFDKPLKKKTNWLLEKLAIEKAANSADGNKGGNPLNAGIFFNEGDKPALARGIETMFRVASREQSALLNIVHQKAGFLASINAIILSVIISVLSTKLQENTHLLIPTVLLMLTCLGTIYFAVVATRPFTINKATGDFNHTSQNILFFGHYTNVSWETYRNELKKISTDTNDLFDILSKNIYYQGHVLLKKYNILARGYNYFIGGLIISVIAFIISYIRVLNV
jgi:hypothetical protein